MRIKSESVYEHTHFVNEKETLDLLIFSTSPSWKEVVQQRNKVRGREEWRKYFDDGIVLHIWQTFDFCL